MSQYKFLSKKGGIRKLLYPVYELEPQTIGNSGFQSSLFSGTITELHLITSVHCFLK